ncbi:MAG: DUF3160 domain-containing protein [Nitrospira sp.]|nr:DUF3160 domain-containing protein [Nitrospira sp.]
MGLGAAVVGGGIMLLTGSGGCGSPASDKPVKSEAREGASKAENRAEHARPLTGKAGQNGVQAGAATGVGGTMQQVGEDSPSPMFPIPTDVAKGLGSPDARALYRALDYWETKGNRAPLDPVFEAMEDEDPAVRAKATAIIEQQWAATRQQE